MTTEELGLDSLESVDYIVVDGYVYEPQRDFSGEWYFIKQGEYRGADPE